MVDVGVGEPDLRYRESPPLDLGQQNDQVATGIDDSGLHRFIAPDDGAVLLEGGNRKGVVVQHGYSKLLTSSPRKHCVSVAVGTRVNPSPPAQIRTCGITAYGSCLRCVTHRSGPPGM